MLPWETPEFKAKALADFEADAPHFQCDGCLDVVPTYLGMYPDPSTWSGNYCGSCAKWWYDDEYEGEEWKKDN